MTTQADRVAELTAERELALVKKRGMVLSTDQARKEYQRGYLNGLTVALRIFDGKFKG